MSGPAAYGERRRAARLAAVQALYQMELGGRGATAVIREFRQHRLGVGAESSNFLEDEDDEGAHTANAPADEDHFAAVVEGVALAQVDLDEAVSATLAQGWRLDRLDATARAILRCAAFELLRRPDVPARVAIDAYVEIAKDFFDGGPEPGFINAALDALARNQRGDELASR